MPDVGSDYGTLTAENIDLELNTSIYMDVWLILRLY